MIKSIPITMHITKHSRVPFEANTTQEQRQKVIDHYKKEDKTLLFKEEVYL